MPSQVSWLLENRVMLTYNQGVVSDQDMFNIDQPVLDYMNQCTAPLVHMIVDHRNGIGSPSTKALAQLQWPKHPKVGWMIMVGMANPFQKFVVAVASNFFKTRMRMFDRMDEALDFLNEIDSTLPMLRLEKLDKAS